MSGIYRNFADKIATHEITSQLQDQYRAGRASPSGRWIPRRVDGNGAREGVVRQVGDRACDRNRTRAAGVAGRLSVGGQYLPAGLAADARTLRCGARTNRARQACALRGRAGRRLGRCDGGRAGGRRIVRPAACGGGADRLRGGTGQRYGLFRAQRSSALHGPRRGDAAREAGFRRIYAADREAR